LRLGLVKKQLHVFKLEAFSTGVATSQNHELIFLQPLTVLNPRQLRKGLFAAHTELTGQK
jgi:hypothetical protein